MAAFPPILGAMPSVLILGSMPGQISLKQGQYYAHPRNAFWWIMSELFDFDLTLDYRSRCHALKHAKVAVWDVLLDCERPGSLDSAIVKATEVPNNFGRFFNTNPEITKVIFNGAKAETLFQRHCKKVMNEMIQARPGFQWQRCPSTSPAHASMTKDDKLIHWRRSIFN